jgi:hypothetical protein
MYIDLTVLVVEKDERCRAALLTALRRLGLRALGVVLPDEAVALLDGIDAEVALLRGDNDDPRSVARLKRKTPLVVVTDAGASVEETVVDLLRALGRPEAAAQIN